MDIVRIAVSKDISPGELLPRMIDLLESGKVVVTAGISFAISNLILIVELAKEQIADLHQLNLFESLGDGVKLTIALSKKEIDDEVLYAKPTSELKGPTSPERAIPTSPKKPVSFERAFPSDPANLVSPERAIPSNPKKKSQKRY